MEHARPLDQDIVLTEGPSHTQHYIAINSSFHIDIPVPPTPPIELDIDHIVSELSIMSHALQPEPILGTHVPSFGQVINTPTALIIVGVAVTGFLHRLLKR